MKLEQVRRFALSLPEAIEAPHHEASSFRVRGKIFATVPPDGAHLHLFVDPHEREAAVAAGVGEPLSWGAKVVGLRIALAEASAPVVRGLLHAAWVAKAPRALLDREGGG